MITNGRDEYGRPYIIPAMRIWEDEDGWRGFAMNYDKGRMFILDIGVPPEYIYSTLGEMAYGRR